MIIYVNTLWYQTTYGQNINNVPLSISCSGGFAVDTVLGMSGGCIGTTGNDCLKIWYNVNPPTNNNKYTYIFWKSELSYPTYIYYESEVQLKQLKFHIFKIE